MLRLSADAAAYGCESSGKCCRGWPVDVDRETAGALPKLLEGVPEYSDRATLKEGDPASLLYHKTLAFEDGHCVFLQPKGNRCDLHGRFGAASKPLICRQYPYLGVRTPFGTDVTLTYSCPSAAKRLLDPGPFRILTGVPGPELAFKKEVPAHYPVQVAEGAPLAWEGQRAAEDAILGLLASGTEDTARVLAWIRMALEALRQPPEPRDGAAVRKVFGSLPPALPVPPRSEVMRLASETLAGIVARRRSAGPWKEDGEKLDRLAGASLEGGRDWEPGARSAYRRYLTAKCFGNLLFYTYGLVPAFQTVLLLGFLVRVEAGRMAAGAVLGKDLVGAVETVERLFPHESGIFDFWSRKGEGLESTAPEASAALIVAAAAS